MTPPRAIIASPYPSLTTAVVGAMENDRALEWSLALAREWHSHLDVLCLGQDPVRPGTLAADAPAELIRAAIERAQAEAVRLRDTIEARIDPMREDVSVEALSTWFTGLGPAVADLGRYADLAILPGHSGDSLGALSRRLTETILFSARAPVLWVPPSAPEHPSFDKIVVAWNGSLEALHAVRLALPLLRSASVVDVVIVDPPADTPERSDPGGRVSLMLSRHGIQNTIRVIEHDVSRVSTALCDYVADKGFDLVVMGAYGHSRIREAVLGGATRHMLAEATFPLLLSR